MRRSVVVSSLVVGLMVGSLPGGAQSADLLEPYVVFDVGSRPEAVATGDVNGDGRTDVVLTTSYDFDPANDYQLFVFLQDPTGALTAPSSYATSGTYTSRPDSVDIGDVTGDGLADVVVGVEETGIEVFPQLSNGALGATTLYQTVDAHKIRLGDLNNDGRLDVAGVGWATDTTTVFFQNTSGTLGGPVVYPVSHGGYEDLEVGDVTGDGRTDIVVLSGQGVIAENLSVVAQLPAGGFGPATYYGPEGYYMTRGIGIGDVTGDGLNDVVGSVSNTRMKVYAQTPAGTLAEPVEYATHPVPEPVEVADLDLDGLADVVTAHGGWTDAGVFRQTATGVLAAEELYPIPYASHYNPHGLDVGDVNGDGAPDVVIADYNNGLIILYNTTDVPSEPGVADLGVELAKSAKSVKRGKPFSFFATVSNGGPDRATGIDLMATITGPHGTLTVNDPECLVAGNQVSCFFDSLSEGSDRTVVISGVGAAKGRLVASASVTGIDTDPNSDNNSDTAKIRVR